MPSKKQSSLDTDFNPFDPLAVENVGVTLAVELLEQPLVQMPPQTPFRGAGIYALYYRGAHPAYADLIAYDAGRAKYPVYIGKAAGESAKQGFNPKSSSKQKLFDRIDQHAKSIDSVQNLSIEDFSCRYLVLNDAYIALAESVMIRVFRPPWNGMSFGSKVVGVHRMGGKPPLWDSLHPGRGGRPQGSTERATVAADLIAKRVAELNDQIHDPVLKRMHDRITNFI
ncbi:Eco29kI family restriction endonuclease [Sphingorhabdus lacus]|uniref:Eco29kI family restriction endonuclease n=1 Tax=Sphingorhabdus lacus TaxID=392610 RepID=A0A6I6LED3_9SPHN|nr:Eco29kI family restriction endonuclease [Sphingorhabdus lacus]QGY80802.1 Eco29kI family restriction endonuclease [Sphingorhabdus lacus]